MKMKLLSFTLATTIVLGMFGSITTASETLSIMVDGKAVTTDVAPFVDANNRTMVPVRFISEALSATVDWDTNSRTVTVTKGSTVIKLVINSQTITTNGVAATMDTAAIIRDGRTFVPVRYIAEALGLNVGWDGATKTVLLTTNSAAVSHPIVGSWGSNGNIVDFMFDPISRSTYGGGASGTAYHFRADGTYQYMYATTGYGIGTMAGWLIDNGKYSISGNQVTLHNIIRSYTDTKNSSNSYKDKMLDTTYVYAFEIMYDNDTAMLKIQNSLTDQQGNPFFDIFTWFGAGGETRNTNENPVQNNAITLVPGTTAGEVGKTYSLPWFSFKFTSIEFVSQYKGKSPRPGFQFVNAVVTVTNLMDDPLPLSKNFFDMDHESWPEYIKPLSPWDNSMMPERLEMSKNQTVTSNLIFEIPAGTNDKLVLAIHAYDNDTNVRYAFGIPFSK